MLDTMAGYAGTTTGRLVGSLDIAGNATTTATYQWYPYQYPWSVSPNPTTEAEVAELRGEVKALREMVAALVAAIAPRNPSVKRRKR